MERDPTEIDERDPTTTTIAQHMAAGSFAGVAEHALMFPMDTVKTMVQAAGGRQLRGAGEPLAAVQGGTSARLATVRNLVANDGIAFLGPPVLEACLVSDISLGPMTFRFGIA